MLPVDGVNWFSEIILKDVRISPQLAAIQRKLDLLTGEVTNTGCISQIRADL
jgi:hypothetical protein